MKDRPRSIQFTILFYFSLVAAVTTLLFGVMLYRMFARNTQRLMTEGTEQVLRRTVVNLEDYLANMRRISDAMFYNVIKDKDLSRDTVDAEMNLLYEANSNTLVSFALYSEKGELISAAPVAVEKPGLDVTTQAWFRNATGQMENLHFSVPHVQNLFDDPSYRYAWVISLSRVVELTNRGRPASGVLLVDMNYSTIDRMLEEANASDRRQYVYLCDSEGAIIYHPQRMQVASGFFRENNEAVPGYDDGVHTERFDGETRIVVVDTVSYTGWRLVSVLSEGYFAPSLQNLRYLVAIGIVMTLLALFLVNRMVSGRISGPLVRLNESIRDVEAGTRMYPEVPQGGSTEVSHLGATLSSYIDRNRRLMEDIVIEQEEKRKSELDALQAQINPHFLYNTLDAITWMVEGGRREEAVAMIGDLASLFRVSLSSGKTVIPVADELRHARNYMNIQKRRFKNAFTYREEIDPAVEPYCIVKLVVQPLLENAIYYGVKDMEEGGEIVLRAETDGRDVRISVSDNGYGIPPENAKRLLSESEAVSHKGSGVGLINVNSRIRLRFGDPYGLSIASEPDEGCRVMITIPAIPYNEENRKRLEEGRKAENNA
ncbi:MAG: sensor histidine kinase [Lachnospiraceae bacterium]|nr:sensor histidine kinase [Lachnospiraceae bacterium]